MSFKKCKVVMLPTEKANYGESLVINKENKLCIWDTNKMGSQITLPVQHLYILSDERIKEGDWFVWYDDIESLYYIFKCKESIKDYCIKTEGKDGIDCKQSDCKKIIATTDKSLSMMPHPHYRNTMIENPGIRLAQPSEAFIEKYVVMYNHGIPITEVMVEYEEYYDEELYKIQTLKVNSKDNTITIRKVKDSWNRDEVVELLITALAQYKLCIDTGTLWEKWDTDKWIEENL